MERHALAIKALTYGAFYYTAECPRLRDMVRFFHEAWDPPSQDLMCKIIYRQMISSIPKELTSKVVGSTSHSVRHALRATWCRTLYPGRHVASEEFMVDIKVWANSSKALKHRRAFKRYIGALTLIDLVARFNVGKP